MRSRGVPLLSTALRGVPIQALLRRVARVLHTSTILAVAATIGVSTAGTLAILNLANEALDKRGGSAAFRRPAAVARAESPPVALWVPVLDETSSVPTVEEEIASPEVAPTKVEEAHPAPEPNSTPASNPQQPNAPPDQNPPECEAPIVGEIPSIPVIGCPLEVLTALGDTPV